MLWADNTGKLCSLQNSMEEGLPVRVIRGHLSKSSYAGKVYTYDGLYKVISWLAIILFFFFFCYWLVLNF